MVGRKRRMSEPLERELDEEIWKRRELNVPAEYEDDRRMEIHESARDPKRVTKTEKRQYTEQTKI